MDTAKIWRSAIVRGLLAASFGLLAANAAAQTPATGECVTPKGPGGLIRGDRIPSGCVLVDDAAASAKERLGVDRQVEIGVPIFFAPGPVFLIIADDFLAGLRPLPRPVSRARLRPRRRAGNFGPLFRKFGPIERHFGPARRDFGRDDRRPRFSPESGAR